MDKKIRVGMDISQLAHKGGVATYVKSLSERLVRLSDLEMVFFYSSLRIPYKGILKNVKKYKLPPTIFELFFNRIRNISIEKFIGPVDIFHSSDWSQPPSKAKKITTFHDLVPIKYPEWSHPKIVSVHKRRLKLVEKEADAVIAVSQATKKDLIELSNIPADKIFVIYEAPSAKFKLQPREKVKRFKEKYNLPEKFVLAIGGVGERRNLTRIRQACSDYQLVVTGEDIPWLNTEELELLYQSASVLVYASLYEGFGIPILDAFSNGLAVITSNVSSMPEVGGEAAIYVDPFNVEDIKQKVVEALESHEFRQKTIKKGFERVKEFSWKIAAKQTAKVYKRLIK